MPNDAIRAVVTDKGRQLAAKLITTHAALQLTAAKVGDGDMPIGVLPTGMTDLAHYITDATMADLGNPTNGEVMVALQIMPADVQAAFFAKEAALYALDPDIGQIAYAYIPMQSDPTKMHPIEDGVGKILLLDVSIPISNIAEVTAALSPSAMVSLEQLQSELAKKAPKIHTHTPDEAGAEQAGAVEEHNTGSTSHIDIRDAAASALAVAAEAKSIAEGRSRAVSYAGYSSMVAAVNIMTKTAMRVGDNLLLEALGVPDLWVSKVESAAVIYAYTTDEVLEAALENGPVQMGYYKLSMLETPKVDLSGYVPTSRTINGKPLTANITLTARDVGARADTWFPTVAEMGLGKTLTFTGAASGTYDGTGDVSIKIPEGGGCVLQITFESIFSGKAFTVTGAGESYTGTVPDTLTADVTVKNVDTEYTVSCDGTSAKVTTGPYFGQCAVMVEKISAVLNENTWAKIRKISDAGTGANYWSVGDTKAITINGVVGNTTFTNLSIDVFIIGFNHNASREGENRIHFQIGKIANTSVALVDSKYSEFGSVVGDFSINTSATNSGGWNGCQMRTITLGSSDNPSDPQINTMLSTFPLELRVVMKVCTKYSDNIGGKDGPPENVTATTDYLFLLSQFEYSGTVGNANSAEKNYQLQYDYYKAGNQQKKYKHNAIATEAGVWTRSVNKRYTTTFCIIGAAADIGFTPTNRSYGVAPGFCV